MAGSNINATNKHQETSLHLAAIANEASIASVLIENGAEVNAIDKGGNNGMFASLVFRCDFLSIFLRLKYFKQFYFCILVSGADTR